MSTLLVSSFTPALGSGRATRTYGIARALALHGPVELLYHPFGAEHPDPVYERIAGLTLRAAPRPGRAARAAAYVRLRRAGMPGPVARGASPALAAAVVAAANDRVIAEDIFAAAALARVATRRPITFSAQNLESAFRSDWGPRERLRAFERALLETFAEVWMPSDADVAGARELAPGASVRYAPNVVDVAAITPVTPHGSEVVMLGDWTYAPNREGLSFLLAEVLPRAQELAPALTLAVAGRGLDPVPDAPPGVRFTGFVPDLRAFYATAAAAVVPLLSGGGSPLKFVEALAHGLPVAATPRAAAGLSATAGEHFLLGEDADGLAGALVAAIDPAIGPRVGAAGRVFAEREYSIEALARLIA